MTNLALNFHRAQPREMGALEVVVAGFVLFYSGVVFCLPVASTEEMAALYPWWGKKISIGNIQLHELFFLLWVVFYGRRFVFTVGFKPGFPARQAATCLMVLALWCGVVSLTGPLPLLDIGRTCRLVLNATLLLAIAQWTRRNDELPINTLIVGFFAGTLINLVLSFRYPVIVAETMRLSGQNTPGVAMGVAIHLCAWSFFRARHHGVRVFTLAVTLVFLFGCAISYSRIGWFAGGLGLCAWMYVLIVARPKEKSAQRQLRKIRMWVVPLLALGFISFMTSNLGKEGVLWVQTLAEQKLERQGDSNSERWAYAVGTMEIISRHPLGVGYTGFFGAMTSTEIYRSGAAPREESVADANPHAAFLWYTTAGGIPGGMGAVLVFVLLLNCLRYGLVAALGPPGRVLFILVAAPFLVIALTVTYIFNSVILLAPAAIAAGWGWSKHSSLQYHKSHAAR